MPPPCLRQPLRLAPCVARQTAFGRIVGPGSLWSPNPPRPLRQALSGQCLQRSFSTTTTLHKSKSKAKSPPAGPPPGKGSASAVSEGPDPFDFSELQTSVSQALERLESAIKLLRPGGRLAPEQLEAIRVKLPAEPKASQTKAGSAKAAADTVRLGDLAQVVPRSGRTIALLLSDAAHAKAVTSALLSSPLALNATAQGGEGTELHVAVPPPTQESRNKAKAQAAEAGDKATRAVRDARQAQHKKHRTMEQGKLARPDDVKRATTKMEEVVKKANEDVKKIVDAAKKAMDG